MIEAMNKKDLKTVQALVASSPGLINTPSAVHEGSPFHHALRFGRRDFALLFLSKGADPAAPASDGLLPLQLVVEGAPNFTQAQVDERTAMAEALLAKKSPLTPDLVLNACVMGAGKARKLAKILLDKKAPLTAVSSYSGYTVLHAAAEYDHPEVFSAALQAKVKVDAVTTSFPKGTTALHLAVKKRATKYIEQLVAAGARSDLANQRNETARSLAPKALLPLLEGKAAAAPKAPLKSSAPPKDAASQLWKSPTDRVALTVFADWLLDQGQQTRAEFIQLSLLKKPTPTQVKRKEQLLAKHRGEWLGAARPLVSAWEDSLVTPGFVARATVAPEKLLAHFELIRGLGPQAVIRLTRVKTRLITKRLAELPLGTLHGLELENPNESNTDWLDDTFCELIAPGVKGLKWLSLAPKWKVPESFTAKSFEVLAPVLGPTLETLEFTPTQHGEPELIAPLTPAAFPALKTLLVREATPALRKQLTAQWKKSRATEVEFAK